MFISIHSILRFLVRNEIFEIFQPMLEKKNYERLYELETIGDCISKGRKIFF